MGILHSISVVSLLSVAWTANIALNANLAWAQIDPLVDAADRRDLKSPAFQEALQSKETTRRILAVRALGRTLRTESAALLLPRLRDESALVRSEACFALGQLGWAWHAQVSDADRKTWTEALTVQVAIDTDSNAKEFCAEAAGRFGDDLFLKKYPEWAQSPNPSIQRGAFRGLLAFRHAKTLPVDSPATWALTQEVQDQVVGTLLNAGETSFMGSIREFAAVLRFHPGATKINELGKRILAIGDADLRTLALSGLKRLPENAERKSLFIHALSDAEPRVRVAALEALKDSNGATAAFDAKGKELSTDSFWAVRFLATQTWAKVPAALSTLKELLNDRRASIRLEAARSIESQDAAWAQAKAKEWAKSSDWQERLWAIERLSLGDEDSKAILQSATKDERASIRSTAFTRLANQGGETGWKLIQELIASGDSTQIWAGLDGLSNRTEVERFDMAWKLYQTTPQKLSESGYRDFAIGMLLSDSTPTSRERLRQIVSQETFRGLADQLWSKLIERGEKDLPPPSAPEEFPLSPYRDLELRRNPILEFETERGKFQIECLVEWAPIHCASFTGQVRAGAYDGMLWHRVIPNFVAQNSNLRPEPAVSFYQLRSEFNSVRSVRGIVGMPRGGTYDSANGGEYGIYSDLVSNPTLDTQYTNFGKIISGLEVVDELEIGDTVIRARWVNP